jgi:hypothetical protein
LVFCVDVVIIEEDAPVTRGKWTVNQLTIAAKEDKIFLLTDLFPRDFLKADLI